jgi:hypothetical protein
VRVEASYGDVVDRVTILRLKAERISDSGRLAHVRAERDALVDAWKAEGLPSIDALPETGPLAAVNARLWDVEDALRRFERENRFDEAFVALARSVYALNDERAAWKRAINERLASPIVEVKSYAEGR